MNRVALSAISLALLCGSAVAQEADPALDEFLAPPEGPSELDALSQGADDEFGDFEEVAARKPISVTLRALNKITAKYTDIVIKMGESAPFGTLNITARYCDKRPPEEFPETTAFVQISDNRPIAKPNMKETKSKAKRPRKTEAAPAPQSPAVDHANAAVSEQHLPEGVVFSGWMFASSPALNGVDHPVYDVWVIDCKTVDVES